MKHDGRPGTLESVNRVFRSLITQPGQKAVRSVGGEPELLPVLSGPGRRVGNRNSRRYTQAYGGTDAIDWVMDCVDIYAQTAANAPYHFSSPQGKTLLPTKTKKDPDEVGRAPQDLAELIRRPTPTMFWTELIELSIIDFMLAGEFIWLKYKVDGLGKPEALYRLSPALVDVVPGATSPQGYIYNTPGGEPMSFSPQEVVHVKRPNPHDNWRGLGIIAGNPVMFDGELALTEQITNYFQQGTKLAGTVETDRSLPDNTLKKLQLQFQRFFGGSKNIGQVAFLERGLRYNSISATATDAQFVQIGEWNMKRICKLFKVPPVLLGEVGGSTDRQAVKEAQRIFDNKQMRPFLNRLQSAISLGLTQAWNVDFEIEYEYVMPIEDAMDLALNMGQLPGVRVREVREQVGLDPLGDDRDEIVLNLPDPVSTADGGTPSPSPGQPGRPPNPANVPQIAPVEESKAIIEDIIAEALKRGTPNARVEAARKRLKEKARGEAT